MTIDELTRVIFQAKINPSVDLTEVHKEFLSRPAYYLVAAPHISKEDWESKKFAVFIEDKTSLVAFLSPEDANIFASKNGCSLDGQALVRKASRETFVKMVAEYADGKLISKIKIFAHVPMHLSFNPQAFLNDPVQTNCDVMKEVKPVRQLVGVDRVKDALNTYEPNARKKLDPGGRYENIHTLVESLIQQNNLSPNELDSTLNLPAGYTRNFCQTVSNCDASQEVLMKYLSYFGLQEYLYLYKKNCLEMMRFLKDHKTIDKFSVKQPSALSGERFKLEKIAQGRDSSGIFVYRLYLKSRYRSFQMVVSSPLNLVVGRDYQIPELDPPANKAPQRAAQQHELPNEEQMKEIAASVGKKKDKEDAAPPSYEETRKNEIIRYFRKQGCDGRAAESKYKTLEMENDILDEFYKYVSKKEYGSLEVCGYTARRIVRLGLSPYEAYVKLIQLRTDPGNTKQFLKYRETDPQYQKSSKKEDK